MALMATTFSAAFQPDTGRPFPCCWPVSFCHWVNRSPQCKWKHTLWKRWFYQKLILICLQHTCTVHSSGSTVLLVVPLTSIAEEVERECHRLGIRVVVGGQVIEHFLVHKACPRMLSTSKLLPPASNWGVQRGDEEEATDCRLFSRISCFKGGTPPFNIQMLYICV